MAQWEVLGCKVWNFLWQFELVPKVSTVKNKSWQICPIRKFYEKLEWRLYYIWMILLRKKLVQNYMVCIAMSDWKYSIQFNLQFKDRDSNMGWFRPSVVCILFLTKEAFWRYGRMSRLTTEMAFWLALSVTKCDIEDRGLMSFMLLQDMSTNRRWMNFFNTLTSVNSLK